MKCSQCETGTMQPGTAPLVTDQDGQLLVLRHIPAEVCEQCGNTEFEAEVVDQAQAQMHAMRDAGAPVAIAEFAPAAATTRTT